MLDYSLDFSAAQSMIASSAAVTQSTNVHSLEPDANNPPKDAWGTELKPQLGGLVWNLSVSTLFAGASSVVTAQLMCHTAAASIKSGTQLAQIVIPAASVVGTRFAVKLPSGFQVSTVTTPHIGVTYTVSGAKVTSGAVNSFLSLENEVHD